MPQDSKIIPIAAQRHCLQPDGCPWPVCSCEPDGALPKGVDPRFAAAHYQDGRDLHADTTKGPAE